MKIFVLYMRNISFIFIYYFIILLSSVSYELHHLFSTFAIDVVRNGLFWEDIFKKQSHGSLRNDTNSHWAKF